MWKHHELEEMLSSILGWNFDDVGFLGCVWPSRKHRFMFYKQEVFLLTVIIFNNIKFYVCNFLIVMNFLFLKEDFLPKIMF